jgi:hypothetical protein
MCVDERGRVAVERRSGAGRATGLAVRAEDGAERAAALAELAVREPELPYSNFPPCRGRDAELRDLQRRRAAADGALAVLVARDARGRPLGCLRLEHRAFESGHFGLRMAAVERPVAVAPADGRAAVLDALYAGALALLRERGYAHAALRASAEDAVAGWAAQRAGALHVGTQVHWIRALDGTPAPAAPPGIALEACDRDGLRRLEPSSWKRLAEWSGGAFHRGPFAFDASLPLERALSLYSIWMEKVFAGEWADGAMLARRDGEVVAVIPMRVLEDVSALAGARVFGRSLAATLPEHQGLCTALMRAMIAERPLGADWMEGDTPVTTWGTINMFAKVGFRYLHATSIFHRRLDEPAR